MRISKKIALAGSLIGASLVSGVAFAAWTADGTGSGYAQAKTAQAVNTVSATTTAELYPGANGSLYLSVANPNDYPVTVTAVSNDTTAGKAIKTTDATTACDNATGVTFTNQTGLSQVIPAHSAGTAFTVSGVHMSNSSDTSCSGKTFNIPVSISAASSAAS
jgi:hypothetical protein